MLLRSNRKKNLRIEKKKLWSLKTKLKGVVTSILILRFTKMLMSLYLEKVKHL
jgi:hypothetical protein